MDVGFYNRCKFKMAQLLRSMGAVVRSEAPEVREQIRSLQTRLAEDRFNLTVVGRFSRGKSSLMNAMLWTDRLPTGLEPLTSVVTAVSYGSVERVVIRYQGNRLPHVTDISSLSEFVTQHGNPGNQKKVEIAEIQMPAELLRQGFFFVDTPGLGSPILENSFTTQQFLPEVDGLILLSGFDSPLDQDELRAADTAIAANRKTFIVLNKRDLVGASEEEDILAVTVERLREHYGENRPELFSVSALQAMKGRLGAHPDLVEQSGIVGLEQAVNLFLLQSKSLSILQQTERRIEEILGSYKSTPGAKEIQEGLSEIREMLRSSEQNAEAEEPCQVAPSSDTATLRPCQVCLAIGRQVGDFMAKYQYQLLVQHEVQRNHAAAGGFCPLHTWQYEAIASPQGISASYSELLDRVARSLRHIDTSDPEKAARAVEALSSGQASCPACRIAADAAREAIAQAVGSLSARPPRIESEFCLAHAAAVVRCIRDSATVQAVLDSSARLLERTSQDMQQFALKHDGLRRYLASSEENKAYVRALLLTAGLRSLALPGNAHLSERVSGSGV